MFAPFVEDDTVEMYGVEAGGLGIPTGKHSAAMATKTEGMLHGAYMYVMQDEAGNVGKTYSVSAGLDYPAIGPEHCHLNDIGRVVYDSVTDEEALEAFQLLSKIEGIIPALESSHAIAYVVKKAKEMGEGKSIIVSLSGRGDKDIDSVFARLGGK